MVGGVGGWGGGGWGGTVLVIALSIDNAVQAWNLEHIDLDY